MATQQGMCNEHLDIAISCSQVVNMHETLKEINTKVDILTQKIEILSTQKNERWKVQGWFNKGLLGLMVTVIIAFKFYGGH